MGVIHSISVNGTCAKILEIGRVLFLSRVSQNDLRDAPEMGSSTQEVFFASRLRVLTE